MDLKSIGIGFALAASAAFAATGTNLLTNGDFSTGDATGWTLAVVTDSDAVASMAVNTDNQLEISVTTAGKQNWNVQLQQSGLSLTSGHTYTLSFEGKATTSVWIYSALLDGSWNALVDSSVQFITTDSTYSYTFTLDTTDASGILQFCVGASANTITIDNMSLVDETTASSSSTGSSSSASTTTDSVTNLISNGDFSNDTTGWSLGVWSTTAAATLAVNDEAALEVRITAIDTANWYIQLYRNDVDLVSGHEYQISFDASSTQDIWPYLAIFKSTHTFLGKSVAMTATDSTYTYTFTADSTVTGATLQFSLGNAIDTITFDNFSLVDLTGDTSDSSSTDSSDFDSGLLTNGDFATGDTTGWNMNVLGVAAATAAVDSDDALVVSITAVDSVNYYVQLQQSGFSLTAGHSYTLSFDATATTSIWAYVEVANTSPWSDVLGKSFNATSTTTTFTYTFTSKSAVVAALLQFDIGNSINIVTIDNVSLIDNGVATAIRTVAANNANVQIIHTREALHFRSTDGEVVNAQIFDLSGRSMAQASAQEGSLSLSNLDKGAYILQVKTRGGKKTVNFVR